LVVEDHDDTREFLATVLGQYGAEVTMAASARTAVAAFERTKPHVVVSDIAMPGEHGYSLIPNRESASPGTRWVRACARADSVRAAGGSRARPGCRLQPAPGHADRPDRSGVAVA
jgi:CheY-like chemotaxis protein